MCLCQYHHFSRLSFHQRLIGIKSKLINLPSPSLLQEVVVMMLLLLVAATVSAASLEPALPKGHRIVPVPVHVYGPEVPGLFGPASQRRDYLERILYTYR